MHAGHREGAFAILHQALDVQHQTCGFMHGSTASAYSALAMVCYQMQQPATALSYQQKALVILEKIYGLDHHQVAQGVLRGSRCVDGVGVLRE
jgi:hypothetical protein